jgi:hypothetical protein
MMQCAGVVTIYRCFWMEHYVFLYYQMKLSHLKLASSVPVGGLTKHSLKWKFGGCSG